MSRLRNLITDARFFWGAVKSALRAAAESARQIREMSAVLDRMDAADKEAAKKRAEIPQPDDVVYDSEPSRWTRRRP